MRRKLFTPRQTFDIVSPKGQTVTYAPLKYTGIRMFALGLTIAIMFLYFDVPTNEHTSVDDATWLGFALLAAAPALWGFVLSMSHRVVVFGDSSVEVRETIFPVSNVWTIPYTAFNGVQARRVRIHTTSFHIVELIHPDHAPIALKVEMLGTYGFRRPLPGDTVIQYACELAVPAMMPSP